MYTLLFHSIQVRCRSDWEKMDDNFYIFLIIIVIPGVLWIIETFLFQVH